MKTILLLISFVLLCTNSTFASPENVTADVIISQKALLQMTDTERNIIFEGLKKQEQFQDHISNDTIKHLADMDIAVFQGKANAVADTLVTFFDKLGVKTNEFINTPVGLLTAVGIIYKIGIFHGMWAIIINIIVITIFLTILYQLNTKKIISTTTRDKDGNIIETKDIIVPKFSAMSIDADYEHDIYAVIGSIVCIVIILVVINNI
jgi:hypothetical protein